MDEISFFQQNNNLLDKQGNTVEILAVLGIYAGENPRITKMSTWHKAAVS